MRLYTHYKDITIGLAYSYLDGEKEHPRALDPWYPRVDHIIAVNGRYRTPQTPEMRRKNMSNFSTDNSFDVLKSRYGDKLTHQDYYGTQLEKRQKCFDIAGELGCDVVIVWDTDDIIHPDYQDWDRFYRQLAYVYEYNPSEYIFKMYCWIPSREKWSPQHNGVEANTWMKYDRIHRDPSNLRYAQNHCTWSMKNVTDEQINEWKWHPDHINRTDLECPFNKYGNTVLDGVRFTTDRALRTKDQLEYGDGWAWQNMHWENYEFNVKPYVHHQGLKFEYEGLLEQYPTLEYYFDKDGRLVPYYLEKGKYVVIKPDRTTEVLQQALAK
jgi:hypothetical protein